MHFISELNRQEDGTRISENERRNEGGNSDARQPLWNVRREHREGNAFETGLLCCLKCKCTSCGAVGLVAQCRRSWVCENTM